MEIFALAAVLVAAMSTVDMCNKCPPPKSGKPKNKGKRRILGAN